MGILKKINPKRFQQLTLWTFTPLIFSSEGSSFLYFEVSTSISQFFPTKASVKEINNVSTPPIIWMIMFQYEQNPHSSFMFLSAFSLVKSVNSRLSFLMLINWLYWVQNNKPIQKNRIALILLFIPNETAILLEITSRNIAKKRLPTKTKPQEKFLQMWMYPFLI